MTEENTEEILKERKRKIKEFFLKKNFIFYLGLIILIILAWQIRTSNVEKLKDVTTGGYTLGPDLDPFLFLRWDKYIVEHGSLMKNDTMRYVPLGYDTTTESTLLPYMMAYFHKAFVVIKPGISVDYSGVIFPAFMFLLTLIAFALMTRKIFENYKYPDIIALIATAFLIFSPSLLSRTIAGIPEKESVGFLFMFLAFYFIVFAW